MMGVLNDSPVATASHADDPVVKGAENPPTTSGNTTMKTSPPSVLEVRLGEEEGSTAAPPSPTSCSGTSVNDAAASYKGGEAVLSPVSIISATTAAKPHYHPQQQPSLHHHHHPMTLPPTKRDDRKLFVGGLPPDVTDDELRGFFAQFGPVFEAVIMFDRTTGRSRGFGFVTFHDQAVRTRLLQELHPNHGRLSMRDRTIEVKPAQPKAFVMPSAVPVVSGAATPATLPVYNDNDHGGATIAPHNENQNISSYGVGLATSGPSGQSMIGNNKNNDSSYAEYYYSQYQASLQHFREQQQQQQRLYQQQQQVYYYPDPSVSITPSSAAAAYSEYYAPPPSPPLTQYPYPNCALPPTMFYPLSHQ